MGVDGGRGGSVRVSVGGGPGPLLMRPVADGKKGFGLHRPQPLTRGQCFKEYMSGVGGIQHDLPCTPQCPGGMQVLEGRPHNSYPKT